MYLSKGFCSMKNDKIPRCESNKVFAQMSFVIWIQFFQIRIPKYFKITLVLLDDMNDVITSSIKHLPFISLSNTTYFIVNLTTFEKNTTNRKNIYPKRTTIKILVLMLHSIGIVTYTLPLLDLGSTW